MDILPHEDVADMRDVFDTMAPEEIAEWIQKASQRYLTKTPAFPAIMIRREDWGSASRPRSGDSGEISAVRTIRIWYVGIIMLLGHLQSAKPSHELIPIVENIPISPTPTCSFFSSSEMVCRLCGRRHRRKNCRVPVHWNLSPLVEVQVFEDEPERNRIEGEIQVPLLRLRDSGEISAVRAIRIWYVGLISCSLFALGLANGDIGTGHTRPPRPPQDPLQTNCTLPATWPSQEGQGRNSKRTWGSIFTILGTLNPECRLK